MPTTPSGRGLGVIFAPPDARNFPYSFVAPPLAAPPPDIDLRAQMQPVGDQGQLGSCTGWAGTASLESRLRDGQRSALYVYARDRQEDGTPLNQDTGASMLGLCKALKDYGAPPESAWPYDIGRFSQAPPASADQAAAGSQVEAYFQIKATGLTLLQGVWDALRQGQTVLVALYVYQSFEETGQDGKVRMPASSERPLGGHAICACGWWNDNSAPGGYGWVMCQNSWGAGFGDSGYVYLPAAYFTSGIVMECWVLQKAAPAPPPAPPPGPPPSPSGQPDPWNDPEPPATISDADLSNEAYQQLGQVRNDPAAEWPGGTLERATGAVWLWWKRAHGSPTPPPTPPPPPGPVPPPPPPPPPPSPPVMTLQGFGGTYGGHSPAVDVYLGTDPDMVEWGRHWGHDVLAPAPGTVSVYTFPTPLNAVHGTGDDDPATTVLYAQQHADLFRGITGSGGCYYGTQTMFFALLAFDTPQRLSNGQTVRAIWIGHCRGDVAAGRVTTGQRWCTVWNSGVNFERNNIPALASHAHTCGTQSGQLSMNGEVSGFLVAQLLGWQVRDVGTIPGPNDYLSGAFRAGKHISAWAGHPLPPPPPG